jgi:4-hydroxy-3-polyprenylbenzoate decarboxylase
LAPPRDLRDWITLLEREGELVRVAVEVDPDLEITEIVDRTVKAGGPGLLFEKPKGSEHPLLINQFGTERRMCLAFGVGKLDDVAQRVADVLEMQPPSGLMEKVRGLQKLKSIADSRPKTVGKGACQEIVLRGDDVNLALLPIQRCWPGDPAPFITLPAVITHDPRTGGRNVGMYRMQVIDERTTFMHWQIHKDGRADYLATDGRIEVAVALGLDPPTRRARRCPSTSTSSCSPVSDAASRSSSSKESASLSRCRPAPRSCSRATSRRTRSGRRGRSAITPAITRPRSRSRSFTSPP